MSFFIKSKTFVSYFILIVVALLRRLCGKGPVDGIRPKEYGLQLIKECFNGNTAKSCSRFQPIGRKGSSIIVNYRDDQGETSCGNYKDWGSYDYIGRLSEKPVNASVDDGENGDTVESLCLQFLGNPQGYKAMCFSTGYLTNLLFIDICLRTCFPLGETAFVYSDAHNHRSIAEGISCFTHERGDSALKRIFQHNDVEDLCNMITIDAENNPTMKIAFVVVEGNYSMEGALCPIDELVAMKEQLITDLGIEVRFFIDEAHSSGIQGEHLRGVAAKHIQHMYCIMWTFSKCYACHGGVVVVKDDELVDNTDTYMKEHPFCRKDSAICSEDRSVIRDNLRKVMCLDVREEIKERALERSFMFRSILVEKGVRFKNQESSMNFMILVDSVHELLYISKDLANKGALVTIVAPPSVKSCEQAIRVCLSVKHSLDEVEEFARILHKSITESRARFFGILAEVTWGILRE